MSLSLIVSLLAIASMLLALPPGHAAAAAEASGESVEQEIDIAPVWAGHPVGFALVTHQDHQFIAFYDDQRRMTVGSRKLSDKTFQLVRLPETVGWDSHNYVAMTVDDNGQLHLSGNMHAHPLVYFRTTRPLDITSFERVPHLVGTNENRVTYPEFFRGPGREMVFTYRDGASGNGNQIYDVYDPKAQAWKRLLDRPLTDGEGHRNAYLSGPTLGPDGYYHLVWVWRETPNAATNHDPSYARSKDLVHWERSDGTPLPLPITWETGEIVDHIPVGGGVINGNVRIGFDTQKRPIVTYHKYDANGKTQIYNARREAAGWKVYQTSDWDYRWDFGGGGSIPFEIGLSGVRPEPDGKLSMTYHHAKYGDGTWLLDEKTLRPIAALPARDAYPAALRAAESSFPGMQVHWTGDSGASGEPGVRYVLHWETLGPNRDQPRTGPLPPPSMLRLYRLRAAR